MQAGTLGNKALSGGYLNQLYKLASCNSLNGPDHFSHADPCLQLDMLTVSETCLKSRVSEARLVKADDTVFQMG